MPLTHDSWMHHNQMRSFWQGVSSGRAYPRWDETTHHGYGAPVFSFYPPGVYYLSSAFYLVLRDWSLVLVALHLTMIAASGMAIYCYARQSMNFTSGLIAMTIYIIAPYHLINIYQRGAIAEQLGFVWIPLVMLFAERIVDGGTGTADRRKLLDFAGLSACFGAFLWSHPPTAYQFLLIFLLSLTLSSIRRARLAVTAGGVILCALLFGSMLAAAYFYPAILEQKFINSDDVEKIWPYHSSYVFDDTQNFYDHDKDGFIARIDRIWLFHSVAIALAGTVLLIFKDHLRSWKLHSRLGLWVPAGLLSAFLMTTHSSQIGRFIPKIEIGVFSWRMLTITSLVAALLAGASWQAATGKTHQKQRTARVIMVASTFLILIGAAAMSLYYVIKPVYRAEAFTDRADHFNFATMPKGVPRELPEMDPAQLVNGNGRVVIERWQPEFRQVRVELDKADRIQFRTSNFPGWTAFVDGRAARIGNGAVQNIVIDLPSGLHQVRLDFRPTAIRRASDLITVVSFVTLILIVMILLSRRDPRQAVIKRVSPPSVRDRRRPPWPQRVPIVRI